jgi:hypothetical protein
MCRIPHAACAIATIMKRILSVVPAGTSIEDRIKALWRALPIEFIELSRTTNYGD